MLPEMEFLLVGGQGGGFCLSGERWKPATPSKSPEQQSTMSGVLMMDKPQSSSQVSPEFYLASAQQPLDNPMAVSFGISCTQLLQSLTGENSSNLQQFWQGNQTFAEPTRPITPIRDTVDCTQSTQPVGRRKESSSLNPRKQRKHRPKVIKEGKAKKLKSDKPPKVGKKEKAPKVPKPPKCSIQKNYTGEVSAEAKYKYAREKIAKVNYSVDTASTPERVLLAGVEKEVRHALGETGRRSCRRVLRFELSKVVEEKSGGNHFDLNLLPEVVGQDEHGSNKGLKRIHGNKGANDDEQSSRRGLKRICSNTNNPLPLNPLHFSLISGENKDNFPRIPKARRTRVGKISNRIWFYSSFIRESRQLLVSPCFKTLSFLNPLELKSSRKRRRKCQNNIHDGVFGDSCSLQENNGQLTDLTKKLDIVLETNKRVSSDSSCLEEREELTADFMHKIDETSVPFMNHLHHYTDMTTTPSLLAKLALLQDGWMQIVPEKQMIQRVPEEKETQIVPEYQMIQRVPEEKETQIVPEYQMIQIVPKEQETQIASLEGILQVVPYTDTFNFRKFKPQVYLDETSIIAWEQRRKVDEGEQTEDLDAEWEKKLEGDRQVFKGRVDSFLARMVRVLGDRRFSQWKGSVLDSIVGVFLTQNVSDHLSSSAFISLAARFPLQERTYETEMNDTTYMSDTSNEGAFMERTKKLTQQDSVLLSQSYTPSSMGGAQDQASLSYGLNDIPSIDKSCNPIWQPTVVNPIFSLQNSLVTYNPFSFLDILQMEGDMALSVLNKSENPFFNRNKFIPLGLHASVYSSVNEYNARQVVGSSEVSGFDVSQVDNTLHPVDVASEISGMTNNIVNSGQCLSLNGVLVSWDVDESNSAQTVKKDPTEPRSKIYGRKQKNDAEEEFDWDYLRKEAYCKGQGSQRNAFSLDSLDYEAVRVADVKEVADAIKLRGQHNVLAQKIQDFLNRLVSKHESLDLEWLRDVQPHKAKDYLLSIRGLGLKSTECVRLLALGHHAFPVDTNVARISVRLGWVPLEPMPESVQLHLLEQYPVMESIQKYLWPRLCKLDKRTLYELHYQMITFGKVFCTKRSPKCHVCPMKAECRHLASACSSAKLALPSTGEKRSSPSSLTIINLKDNHEELIYSAPLAQLQSDTCSKSDDEVTRCEPLIEEPASPAHDSNFSDPEVCPDIEDFVPWTDNADDIITINLCNMHENNLDIQDEEVSNALVALSPEAASIPMPKLKNVKRLQTMHLVYEVPDSHILLRELESRDPDDPCPYLIAIWAPGETAQSIQPPETSCGSQDSKFCGRETCVTCHGKQEAAAKTVRATLLIPCRTAMRGSFPLNGTYFQINEVFADHQSSLKPIDVPRSWLWNLPRRLVYFGASITAICRDLPLDETCHLFSRAFICVRAFERKTRYPKPLSVRLHCLQSKTEKRRKGRKKSVEELD